MAILSYVLVQLPPMAGPLIVIDEACGKLHAAIVGGRNAGVD